MHDASLFIDFAPRLGLNVPIR